MPCHFVKKNRPFPVKITICSLCALWYHRKKDIVFYEKGICMKSIAGVLAVTLNLLILTLIWGFAYLHAYTDAPTGLRPHRAERKTRLLAKDTSLPWKRLCGICRCHTGAPVFHELPSH